MQHVIGEQSPTYNLHWELTLPPHLNEAAIQRCVKRKRSDIVLYDDTFEFAYFQTLAAMTAVFTRVLKFVYFDGEALHFFLDHKFVKSDQAIIRHLFRDQHPIPDMVLHDILVSEQGLFATRDATNPFVTIETVYRGFADYEGTWDYTELHDVFRHFEVTKENTKAIVLKPVEITEHHYPIREIGQLYTPVMGKKGLTMVDSYAFAQRMVKDRMLLINTVTKAKRFFDLTVKKK